MNFLYLCALLNNNSRDTNRREWVNLYLTDARLKSERRHYDALVQLMVSG